MKVLTKSVVLPFLSIALLFAQGASAAQVVSETPDGALVVSGGTSVALEVGSTLKQGDVVKSKDSTVILALCNGSLLTIYPGTEVTLSTLSNDGVMLGLIRGEILGDTATGCPITVDSVVGTANITSGVSGVLMNETGSGWTLQVRNLDASVSFTGDAKLDTSNLAVSLVEPNQTIDVAAGDEMTVRGVYDASLDIFSIVMGGAVMAMMSDTTIGQIREDVEYMSAAGRPSDLPARDRAVPRIQETDTPAEDRAVPVIIEIPWNEVETASDKG